VAEPLVVHFRPKARQDFERRASRDPIRRGRAAIQLAVLLTFLLLVPWIALNVTQGFEPRSLVLLAFLAVPALAVIWGRRKTRDVPVALGAVAFVVTDDALRFEPHPSANSALRSAPAEVWPRTDTSAQVRPRSVLVGERLVLRAPGRQRRVYLTDELDTPADAIRGRLRTG
jgi:hypothetical protein